MPPMSLQMTGRPNMKASWITSGEFSHQIDGTMTQSTLRIDAARSRWSYRPTSVTASRVLNKFAETVLEYAFLKVQIRAVHPQVRLAVSPTPDRRPVGSLERREERIVRGAPASADQGHGFEQDPHPCTG